MSSLSFPDLTPYLDSVHDSLPPSLQPYFTRQHIQLVIRGIVILSTFLLFQPRLAAIFRKATGMPDEREEELKARLDFLQQQREGGGGVPPKNFGIVGKDGSVRRVAPVKQAGGGEQSPASGKKGKPKGGRKKA
jgi:hypothetical protein